ILFWIEDPRFAFRDFLPAERRLQPIKFILDEGSLFTEKHKAWPRREAQHGRMQVGAQIAGIIKADVERIVGEESLALDADVGSNPFRRAEEYHRMVHQV